MSGRPQGFALMLTALVLLVAASVAFLLINDVSMGQRLLTADRERAELQYVAEAGIAHARWYLGQNTSCTAYAPLPATGFGAHSYNASYNPTAGSPVDILLTGTHSSGVTRKVSREQQRVFQTPVVLALQLGADPGKDAMLDSWYGNYGGANFLQIDSVGSWRQRPVIEFDLSAIPPAASIISAELQLLQWSLGTPGDAAIHRLTRSWVEGTKNGGGLPDGATWTTYDGSNLWLQSGGDFAATVYATRRVTNATIGQWVAWDMRDLVSQWVSGAVPNFGLVLVGDGTLALAQFASRNWVQPLDRPKLTVRYACECGMTCAVAGGSNVLLVVVDPGSLLVQEAAKKSLIESWGHTVNLIDESANQASFDAAFAVNDVVYVPEDIASSNVSTKLVNATIGVVNEEGELVDELGFSQDKLFKSRNQIDVVDNAHFITELFAPGLLTFVSSAQSVHMLSGTMAPGLQTLGETHNTGAVWNPSLAVVDAGGALHGGGNAEGRRVQLPWGGGTFDVDQLTDDGRTIMRRALEWGAEPPADASATIILATESGATLGGLTFTDKDLAEYDPAPDTAVLFLDGAALGLANDIDAVHVLPNGTLVLSAINTITLGGATAENEDLIAYDPATDTGALMFDGSALFTAGSTDVSALHVMDNGHLLLTNEYPATLGGLSFQPNDIVEYDPATDTAALFFDGSAVGLSAWIDALHVLENGNLVLSTDAADILGGLNFDVGDLIEYDPGTDTAALYFDGNLFSSGENVRAAHITGSSGALSGPIAHWKLDDGVGTTAVDSVGNHDGTVIGANWSAGILGDALDFDGVDDYVDVGTFDVSGSGITLMAWFNAETISTNDGRLISKASGTNASDAWWQLSSTNVGANRYLRMRIKAGGTTTTFADSTVNLATGQWYFAVATYDNATGDMKLYLDGAEVASGAHSVGGAVDVDPSVAVAIGANGTVERFFDGLLDDVRVYNRALSAAEIFGLYVGGGGGGPPSGNTFRDEFLTLGSYSGDDGSRSWSTDWLEINEADGASLGDERVINGAGGFVARVQDNDSGGEGLEREADLSGFTTATLTFQYWRGSLDNVNDYVSVDASADGGSTWTELDRIEGPASDPQSSPQSASYDLTPYIAPNTRIRFLTSPTMGGADRVYLDDIQISAVL